MHIGSSRGAVMHVQRLLACWGNAACGRLGLGFPLASQALPRVVPALTGYSVKQVGIHTRKTHTRIHTHTHAYRTHASTGTQTRTHISVHVHRWHAGVRTPWCWQTTGLFSRLVTTHAGS